MKLLFDNSGELVVWSEGDKLFLSVSGNEYELTGSDLEFFAGFVNESVKRIERERDNNKPLMQILKELWGNTN